MLQIPVVPFGWLSHSPPSLGVIAAVAVADLAFGIVADG